MDTLLRRPVATPAYAVKQSSPHQILVCKACKHRSPACAPGHHLLKKLRAAVQDAGLDTAFEVTGTACLAGCGPKFGSPCVVAWRAAEKATWMFGDIDPHQPMDDLIAFSTLYASLPDGWMSGADCPQRMRDTTLARIPAAILTLRKGGAS